MAISFQQWTRPLGLIAAFMVVMTLSGASADAPSADELVRKLAAEMTLAVRSDPELQNPGSLKISDFVQKNVVPKFDFERITQIAMGRNWAKANPSEQKQIVAEFSKLLTRTYSNAIATLKELDVEVKSTRVSTPNADVINSSSGWRVYDVTVEGISLVAAYRDEFAGLVSQSGVSGLIDALKKKNGG